MASNITLIGMPGAGKSTIGIILAKALGFGFIDTDVLIQTRRQQTLQQIIDTHDHLYLRSVEEKEILSIHADTHIIATGGSAVYSEKAMNHLSAISTIIFLDVAFEEIQRRIHNFETRGIAKAKHQTFSQLFAERRILYKKYADISIHCHRRTQEELVDIIIRSSTIKRPDCTGQAGLS